MTYSKEFLIGLYKDLITVRLFEKKLYEIYALGIVPGHIHSGIGEEATYIGTLATRKTGDYFKMTHRSIGVMNILGVSLEKMFSEILAKKTGNSEGRGGVNHIAELDKGILGLSGTLGCDIPVAVGAGITIQYNETDNIVYAYFGDGTSSRGPIHEAMNFAAAWKLPVLFICGNNQFAISTPITTGVPVKNPGADRASAYGMPSKVVDGTNVLKVYETAKELTEYIRKGNGPAILESKSYRWRGHFEGDPAPYRDRTITDQWINEKDCVKTMEAYLLNNKLISNKEIDEFKKEIDFKLERAIEFAENSPELTPDEIYNLIYV